jgi:PPOX class probable F420-dependent enzyme
VDRDEMRNRLAAARVGRLATVTSEGRPHLVPVCFAIAGPDDTIVSAVDTKPKRTTELRRLANLRTNPAAGLLVDEYDDDDDDWSQLWWVRVDGNARVVRAGSVHDESIAALAAKYQQYRESPPAGPAIVITVTSWHGWKFAE